MIFHGRFVKSKNSRFNSSIFFIVIIPYHAVTISNLNYLDSFSHHCGFSFPVSMTAMKAKTKCIKPKLSTPCLMVVSVVSYPSLQQVAGPDIKGSARKISVRIGMMI